MAMGDTYILMEITIQEIGLMENGQAGVNWLINQVKLMKECGNTVNSWALDYEYKFRSKIKDQDATNYAYLKFET